MDCNSMFLKDLEKLKMCALQDMLKDMQTMRGNRIGATYRRLIELLEAIAAAETTVEEGERQLLLVWWEERLILRKFASDERLASWVQNRMEFRNPLVERALERAMRRALGEKGRDWEREEWERERERRWAEEEEPGQKRKRGLDMELPDRQWEQEWALRENERQILDRVDLRELELRYSKLRKMEANFDRGADGLGEGKRTESQDATQKRERLEKKRKELDLAFYWNERDLDIDLKSETLDPLKAWLYLVNRPASVEVMAAQGALDLELLSMAIERTELKCTKERLEEDQAFGEITLQEASSYNWQDLDLLAEALLSLYPTQDRLPLAKWQIFGCSQHESGHNLLNIILRNRRVFTAQKSCLKSLLVFAGVLMCAVVVVFMAAEPNAQEARQRGILFQILRALQSIPLQPLQPLQPTPALSIWAGSFMTSLAGAAVVALTTFRGWCTIDSEEARAIFSTPEGLQRRLKEIRRSIIHLTFQDELSFLANTATILFYLSFALFFAGFGVLLYMN